MPLCRALRRSVPVRNFKSAESFFIIEQAKVPVIVDAGVGSSKDAAYAMELGADGVLLNTAVSGADDPVKMARAMKLAVEAGRLSYEAGRIPVKDYGTASSPRDGLPV